jgi:lysophospholipase L1-like esterase
VLVVAPPRLAKLSDLMGQHFDGSIERSSQLPRCYRQVCADLHCHFFDSNDVVEVAADGVHLDADGHRTLAQALAPVVRSLLKSSA